MSKISFFRFLIFTAAYVARLSYIRADGPNTPTWAKTTSYGHEQKTLLEFYFHELSIGDNATVALIAQNQAQPKDANGFAFGDLFMADELLTVGPDINSQHIGQAQGFSGLASKEGINSFMGLAYCFTDGIYNGSSIVILGRNEILNPVRELPVIGGTGLFRMARGYALAHTYYFNSTSGIVIIGYNVTVFHP